MKLVAKYRKRIAALLLLVMTIELVSPATAYALTSGPTQPEMKGFEPVGNSDMVDLFSGDFSYNIPLMDIGGYPVNLAYGSGSGMDDEAGWVGKGWTLNVGSLNRQLRGIPDDFNGSDLQQRELSMKDHITKGGRFSMTLDLLGVPVNKVKKKKKKRKLNLSLTVSVGVKVDNYRGVGMELGANSGVAITDYVAGDKTKNDPDSTAGRASGSVGLNLSSFDGASLSVNASILRKNQEQLDKSQSVSSSLGFGYNSRTGLTGMTLGGGFSSRKAIKDDNGVKKWVRGPGKDFSSFISFNGETYSPTIDHATNNNSYTFSLHLGPELWFALPGIGLTGFYSKQKISQPIKSSPAYGYLNSEKGKNVNDALLDFNREKDIPYTNQVKYLPIPVPTYDLFSASSQNGGGQFRLYRGSSGVYFDQRVGNTSDDFTVGIEAGGGAYFDVGADLYKQSLHTVTQKWRDRNGYLAKGDFQDRLLFTPLYEPAYFKRVGEPVPYDNDYVAKIKGTAPAAVHLPQRISDAVKGAQASDLLRTNASPNGENTVVLKRDKREVRNTTFGYLTGKEAALHGLDKTIRDLHPDSLVLNNCISAGIKNNFQRAGGFRKSHHFSEITITGDDGKRTVYGIPVYNTFQEEVTFSIGQNLSLRNKGLINYSEGTDNSRSNNKGRENYFSKEKTPSYATSYLLTGILSPDYVDKSGDGVTDDDQGTAVKFNYTRLNNLYNWRTPYALGQDTANYNEGFLSEALDDKANYVYGQKEVWYLHSVESKTMVAHFILGDRRDACGTLNSRGAIDTTNKLKYLKEIRLYSKSDLQLNNNNPAVTIPIKVVHFEYDYSLIKGLPNNIDREGKLTLKKVWFTFGLNQKGKLNPYEFKYDTSFNKYDYRQYDRWGTFKKASDNPNGLNNSEFPYTLQDTSLTNDYAGAWELNEIILPSGGKIRVTYESDDYSFVQNRRASQMCFVQGAGTQGSSTGLVGADFIFVSLPKTVSSQAEMLERYFEGIENLYYKCFLDLDNKGHEEFIPGYAKIVGKPELISNNIAKIRLEKKNGANPIAFSGWQFLRTSLPKYAYPGSDNLESNQSDLKKVITALITAFVSIRELFSGYEKRAKNKGFSDNIDLTRSWVRLCSPEWRKIGGGSRVKKVEISDEWAAMSGASGSVTATYTQLYDYSTTDTKNRTISSGVASYEPIVGNDENPWRQPIRYKSNQFLGLDNYYYIEEPFGESFFPAASVGYSKVSVRSIGSGDDESVNRTGVTTSEFYTAKDFPTKVTTTNLQQRNPGTSKLFKLVSNVSVSNLGLSQGYAIELNDMHGKPKSVNVFNKSGQKISSVEHFYQMENELAEKKTLRNDVNVIGRNGIVSGGHIGMDVEMFTDMRQQTTENLGVSVKVSGGSGAILFFPLPFFFPGIGVNYDKRNYRSASTIKLVQRFGIQYKTRKMADGSSITTENLLWDAETGNIILTKTQNEFEDPMYQFAYPAHWVYDGMGQAYRNLGTIFSNFSTNSNGQVTNSVYNLTLMPGDELIDVNSSNKYWTIRTPIGSVFQNRLINEAGDLQQVNNLTMKLLRSGRRNMANNGIATIASLNNPIVGDRLDITQLTKVLDAKAAVFSEEWSVPFYCTDCPPGYQLSPDGINCFRDTVPIVNEGCYTICEGGHHPNYGPLGTYIFDTGYALDGTGTVDTIIDENPFWVGSSCGEVPPPGFAAQNKNIAGKNYDSAQMLKNAASNSFELLQTGDTCADEPGPRDSSWCGPLNRTGIWSCESVDGGLFADRLPLDHWLGFSICINVPTTKTYYLGIASDNLFRFHLDGELRVQMLTVTADNFNKWFIFPLFLTQGQHYLSFEANNAGGPASFGAELYDNTRDQIAAADGYEDLTLLFTTRDMIGQQFQLDQFVCPSGYSLVTCNNPFVCREVLPINYTVNPYKDGFLGNWRLKSQVAYQVNRETIAGNENLLGSTNIRKSGAYSIFNPFWKYNYTPGQLGWSQNPAEDERWILTGDINSYNKKGLEVETHDALGRYSAAVFGFLESMPVAIGSNTRYREIGYDGFEDYGFANDCSEDTCNPGHFSFKTLLNGSTINLSDQYAHSGKHSLLLNGNVTLSKTVYTGTFGPSIGFSGGTYALIANEMAKGFSPVPGEKYVLSFWVKDNSPRDPATTVQASVNGLNLVNGASNWPIVEGWKRVVVQFVMPAMASDFSLQLQSSGGTVYFDDIRIHPYDAQLKTYAYDASTQRMMAELDENNFASFYEYDDEGIMVRAKKETERGIVTVRESRSAYRKKTE